MLKIVKTYWGNSNDLRFYYVKKQGRRGYYGIFKSFYSINYCNRAMFFRTGGNGVSIKFNY